jgi:glutamate-5-semialdehyde dehydrogenase
MSIRAAAEAAKASLPALARSTARDRDDFLLNLAENIIVNEEAILETNDLDVTRSRSEGRNAAFLDRLTIDPKRLDGLAQGIRDVAALPDPLGGMEDVTRLPSGLTVGRMRVPLGVIAFICEARPGAVVEAAALAVKSGNAIVCKPGSESRECSEILGAIIRHTLDQEGLPEDAVTVLSHAGREGVAELVSLDGLVDVAIPRGGEGLIRQVAESARVPVLRHYKGVCHIYVDSGADLEMALRVILDAKTSRPGTCNALECALVHADEAQFLLPKLAEHLMAAGVQVHASPECLGHMSVMGSGLLSEATAEDFGREFLALEMSVRTVTDMEDALAHIRRYGSNHTEGIVTNDLEAAMRFTRECDASCVMVNASTRLNDGGCLGLGAEIGISTSKLHAYGPMGLKELTSRKFVVLGEGHVRG